MEVRLTQSPPLLFCSLWAYKFKSRGGSCTIVYKTSSTTARLAAALSLRPTFRGTNSTETKDTSRRIHSSVYFCCVVACWTVSTWPKGSWLSFALGDGQLKGNDHCELIPDDGLITYEIREKVFQSNGNSLTLACGAFQTDMGKVTEIAVRTWWNWSQGPPPKNLKYNKK